MASGISQSSTLMCYKHITGQVDGPKSLLLGCFQPTWSQGGSSGEPVVASGAPPWTTPNQQTCPGPQVGACGCPCRPPREPQNTGRWKKTGRSDDGASHDRTKPPLMSDLSGLCGRPSIPLFKSKFLPVFNSYIISISTAKVHNGLSLTLNCILDSGA